MKKALLVLAALFLTSVFSSAQDRPQWEFFGGYQYERLDVHDVQNALNLLTKTSGLPQLNFGDHLSANGWNVSLQNNANNWFGLVFDLGGVYSKKDLNLAPILSLPPGTTAVVRIKPSFYTVAGGPQFTYRKSPRYQPFARVLLGMGYERASANALINDVPVLTSDVTQSQKAFDFTAGGGFDYHFRKHLAVRTSADYIRTYFSSLTQNNLRVSVGLTYRLTASPF